MFLELILLYRSRCLLSLLLRLKSHKGAKALQKHMPTELQTELHKLVHGKKRAKVASSKAARPPSVADGLEHAPPTKHAREAQAQKKLGKLITN